MTLSDIDLGDIAIFTWTVLQIALTVRYGFWSRWRATVAGQILLASFCCTSIALLQVSITLLTDSGYPLRDIARPIAYTLGIIGTVVMLVLLLRMQRKDGDR